MFEVTRGPIVRTRQHQEIHVKDEINLTPQCEDAKLMTELRPAEFSGTHIPLWTLVIPQQVRTFSQLSSATLESPHVLAL
jgi:hypothetical protein